MYKKRLLAIPVLLAFTAIACNLGNSVPSTATEENPAVEETATPAPETTATDLAANPELEVIAIFEPTSGSSIASPVTVHGNADPAFEQTLVVSITDENGIQLAIGPTIINAPLGERGSYSANVNFSVASQQPGRISVYTVSAMNGGLEHLSSVEVQLLPTGNASLSGNSDETESIQILAPQGSEIVQGGNILVSGYSDYYFESSLGLMLCGPGGSGATHKICGTDDNVLASGVAMISSPDIGQAGPFSGSLSYSIGIQTIGRIVVYATSPRDGGIIHLSSNPVEIMP